MPRSPSPIGSLPERLTARQAAELLNVSLATLYSYVSRGLLEASAPGAGRRKSYARDEVLRLAARRADAKRAGHVATGAMHWGLPVLETEISGFVDGRLRYRGQDPLQLAQQATLEEVAQLLWADPQPRRWQQRGAPALPEPLTLDDAAWPGTQDPTQPLRRAMVLLPRLVGRADAGTLDEAVDLLRQLAAVFLQRPASTAALHQQLAIAWGLTPADAELLRMALVLLADHELNASTFAVRCVASSGAPLPLALCAGLGALAGPRHGGGHAAVRARLLPWLDQEASLTAWPLGDEGAGLGHPLYPEGDPRSFALLQALASLEATSQGSARGRRLLDLAAQAQALGGQPANADLSLAVLGLARGWPTNGGEIVFALARAVGWLAHAREQQQRDTLIRPRARYVGPSAG